MHIILYMLATWLSIAQFVSAAKNPSGSERENAMRALITMVRQEQLWPSRRPDHQRYSRSGYSLRSPTIAQPAHLESIVATQSTYDCFNSILSAVAPSNELAQAHDDLKLSLLERYCSERLPADLREFLGMEGLADERKKGRGESFLAVAVEGKTRGWRIRGWDWRGLRS